MLDVMILLSRFLFVLLTTAFVLITTLALKKKDNDYLESLALLFPSIIGIIGHIILYCTYKNLTLMLIGLFVVILLDLGYIFFKRLYKNETHIIYRCLVMLINLSLVEMRSLSSKFFLRQSIIICVGIIMFLLLPLLLRKVRRIKNIHYYCMAIGVILLLIMLVRRQVSYGAVLSINLGFFSFQPFELVKIVYIIFLSKMIVDKDRKKSIIAYGVYGILSFILVLSNDYGSVMILFVVTLLITYVVYGKLWIIVAAFACVASIIPVIYTKVYHVRERVNVWMDPFAYIDDSGYQISQSMFAISSGGAFGSGLGKGMPQSIPVVEKDFMFSAIAEEMGLIVAILMIVVCLYIFLIIMEKSKKATVGDNFTRLSLNGFALLYIFQIFLTVGGASKFIPSTGVTLPFVSYGGSSFMGSILMMSVVVIIISENRKGIHVAR